MREFYRITSPRELTVAAAAAAAAEAEVGAAAAAAAVAAAAARAPSVVKFKVNSSSDSMFKVLRQAFQTKASVEEICFQI